MDAWLQSKGADDAHRREQTQAAWEAVTAQVTRWATEDYTAALAEADDSASSMKGAKREALSVEKKAARTLVRQTVDRSQRAYGHLYSALPDALQLQVAHLPRGWAYGLWTWLEQKFQSTEDDNVDSLFGEWTALAQAADESFDAYRARVDRVRTLLAHAKEEMSPRMYAFALLGKLQPHFKPAVLALKNGELLRDAKNVDWEAVTRFINAHERSEQRLEQAAGATHEGQPGGGFRALAAMGHTRGLRNEPRGEDIGRRRGDGGRDGQSRRADDESGQIECFRCHKMGNHIARDCPEGPRDGLRGATGAGGRRQQQGRSWSAARDEASDNDEGHEVADGRRRKGGDEERANAVRQQSWHPNWRRRSESDDSDDDDDAGPQRCYASRRFGGVSSELEKGREQELSGEQESVVFVASGELDKRTAATNASGEQQTTARSVGGELKRAAAFVARGERKATAIDAGGELSRTTAYDAGGETKSVAFKVDGKDKTAAATKAGRSKMKTAVRGAGGTKEERAW